MGKQSVIGLKTQIFIAGGGPTGVSAALDNLEFKLELNRKQDTLIIPRWALRNYQSRDFVLVVDGDTRREADVQRGIATRTEVEIIKGLDEGQLIVVNP